MTNSSFFKKLLFALSVVFFVSCDKDFTEIGSDIVGDDLHSTTTPYYVDVTAYDRPMGAVQSNNLTLNQLGIFDNPTFGKTVSHFVTQLEIPSGSQNPTLYSPVIDSVYIYIPYNSTVSGSETDSEDTGTRTLYTLNSVYGKADATFKLEVYRNGFYLRDADPAATDKIQRYYSDDFAMVENLKVGEPLVTVDKFGFSPTEIKRKADPRGTNDDGSQPTLQPTKLIERKAPGISLDLDKAAMQEALFGTTNRGNLLNNNLFKNYFRGLYFKVTQDGDAVATIPKFSEGIVTIKYHDKTVGIDGNPTEIYADKTLTLNMTGNTINFYENTVNPTFNSAITNSDAVNGDSNLYVKGGAGSMAIININKEGLEALDSRKTGGQKVLINEANLVFYVDQSKLGTATAPLRVYLYNLRTKQPLYDYSADGTTVTGNTKYNKYIHGGILDTIKDPVTGVLRPRYKIRLTNHINSIVNSDSTNVRLGLVVTEDITVVTNGRLKTPFTEGVENNPDNPGDFANVNMVPIYSIQHPFGTVLYGSNVPDSDKDKKVRLEIFYTKPN